MKAIAGAAPRGDSLLAQLGLHQLDDVLEGGLVDEAVEEELHRPAPQLAVAAPGRRGDGQHLRRCRPGGGRRLEEADVDEVALRVDDVPQALRRGPDDANQEVVVGSVRLGRSDELEELGVVRCEPAGPAAESRCRGSCPGRGRARPRARGASTSSVCVSGRSGIGFGARSSMKSKVMRPSRIASPTASKGTPEVASASTRRTRRTSLGRKRAVLRRDDAELAQLLDRLLRRATRDRDLGDAQLPHASNRSQAFEKLAPGLGIRLVERAGA